MKKVINVILVIILVVSFISFGLLNTSRNVLNTTTHEVTSDGKVNGIGAKYEIKGDRKTVSYAEIYNIDKIDLNIVHQYLDEDLKKQFDIFNETNEIDELFLELEFSKLLLQVSLESNIAIFLQSALKKKSMSLYLRHQ